MLFILGASRLRGKPTRRRSPSPPGKGGRGESEARRGEALPREEEEEEEGEAEGRGRGAAGANGSGAEPGTAPTRPPRQLEDPYTACAGAALRPVTLRLRRGGRDAQLRRPASLRRETSPAAPLPPLPAWVGGRGRRRRGGRGGEGVLRPWARRWAASPSAVAAGREGQGGVRRPGRSRGWPGPAALGRVSTSNRHRVR